MSNLYKAEVRNSDGWRSCGAATLGISVTSPNWTGEKLEAILALAIANFSVIRVDVTDALYRHSFIAEGHSPETALDKANALGALWLAQHEDVLRSFSIEPSIVRWAEWYCHPEYKKMLKSFQDISKSDAVLQNAINADVREFYRRKNGDPSALEVLCSQNYLIEEMAVLTLQAKALPGVKLYPGDELNCLRLVRQGLVPDAPRGLELEKYAKIKFAKKARGPLRPDATSGGDRLSSLRAA